MVLKDMIYTARAFGLKVTKKRVRIKGGYSNIIKVQSKDCFGETGFPEFWGNTSLEVVNFLSLCLRASGRKRKGE